MRYIWGKRCREDQSTHFMFNKFFFNSIVCELMWKNTVQPDGSQMTIWCMGLACWITPPTHARTHTHTHTHTHNMQRLNSTSNNRSLQSSTTDFNTYSYRLLLGLHVSNLRGSSSGPHNNIGPNILLYKCVVASPKFTDKSIC